MAKVSFILEMRFCKKSGYCPIKLRIVTKSTNTTVSTRICVPQSAFTGNPDRCISPKYSGASELNIQLRELYYQYTSAILELEKSGRIETMTAADIRDYVTRQKEYSSIKTFSDVYQEYRNMCRTTKTKQGFDYMLQMMNRYEAKEKYYFEDINYKFLVSFEHWMEENNIGVNSRSIVFRNIRTIYNYSIKNDYTSQNMYPFKRFKIRNAQKDKEYLHENKMRELLSLDLSGVQGSGVALARDFFVLSFLLCGINPIDLYNLPYQTRQIKFVRQKVAYHEPDAVKISIQPEAECLICERQGKDHLLNLSEKYQSFSNCYRFMVKSLKKLGDMIGEPNITFYWARYSWATYASKLEVSDSVISKALGHAESTLAEKRYVTFDWAKVDRANRRVIDYVLYGK